MKKFAAITTLMFAAPLFAFAQSLAPFQQLLVSIGNLVSLAIPIAIGALLLVVIWEGYHYIHNPKNPGPLIGSVVALFVIVSIWGLVHLMQNALLGGSYPQTIGAPHFPTN